jgi:hypothetical protein
MAGDKREGKKNFNIFGDGVKRTILNAKSAFDAISFVNINWV